MTRQEYKEIYDVVGAAMEFSVVTTSLIDSNKYYGYYD